MEYQWNGIKRDRLGDVQIVGARLDGLRRMRDKRRLAELVVDDAADPASPLHAFFEWDDSEAAQKYRLQQADDLIRAVVVIKPRETPEHNLHAAVAVTPASPGSELRVDLDDAGAHQEIVRQAIAELKEFRKRYERCTELEGILAAIDAVVEGRAVMLPTPQRRCDCGAITKTTPCHVCLSPWRRVA